MCCQVKIRIRDQRFCRTTEVFYNLNGILYNEILIKDVPLSANFLYIFGNCSSDILPGFIFIKYGTKKWETRGLLEDTLGKIDIYSMRKDFSFEPIELRIRLWFPTLAAYRDETKIKEISYVNLEGAINLPTKFSHPGGNDEID